MVLYCIAEVRPCLPVQWCVVVIEGVVMLLRRWIYCDPAIFICVSGNYVGKNGFMSLEKEVNAIHAEWYMLEER